MTKDLWINLPVKNIKRSKDFFTQIGFSIHPRHKDDESMVGILVGEKNVMLMLFLEDIFKGFVQTELSDTSKYSEVLFSFDAESKEEVDEMLIKVEKAGGKIIGKPDQNNWLYGFGFADLDGHRWNILYMDMSKMPNNM